LLSAGAYIIYSYFGSSLLRATGSNINPKSDGSNVEMNGISVVILFDFITIDFVQKGSARCNIIAAANKIRMQSMLLGTSSQEIVIINDAMSMIALRIGSSKVAKVRSASLPPLPSP
jgi:hypothetical protein